MGPYFTRSQLVKQNISVNSAKSKKSNRRNRPNNGSVDTAQIIGLDQDREVPNELISRNEITGPDLEVNGEQSLDVTCKQLSFKTWFIETNHPFFELEEYKKFRCELKERLEASEITTAGGGGTANDEHLERYLSIKFQHLEEFMARQMAKSETRIVEKMEQQNLELKTQILERKTQILEMKTQILELKTIIVEKMDTQHEQVIQTISAKNSKRLPTESPNESSFKKTKWSNWRRIE